jgi:uncharacterized protein YdaT
MDRKRPISAPGPISALDTSLEQAVTGVLKGFGWAPGNYMFQCHDCPPGKHAEGDKRAFRCKDHAILRLHQALLASIKETNETNDDLAELREVHAKRVSELIRANSEQVVRRREINAHRMVLLAYVSKARDKFRFYGRQHRDKIVHQDLSQELIAATLAKAEVNDQMADEGDAAILFEVEPGAMGRP